MKLTSLNNQKLEIEYPVKWNYRIIGKEEKKIQEEVSKMMVEEDFTLESGRESSGGKYISVSLSLVVSDENHRLSLFEQLKSLPSVIMVL
jgi:putative lipoic acid-binding regulatory protein